MNFRSSIIVVADENVCVTRKSSVPHFNRPHSSTMGKASDFNHAGTFDKQLSLRTASEKGDGPIIYQILVPVLMLPPYYCTVFSIQATIQVPVMVTVVRDVVRKWGERTPIRHFGYALNWNEWLGLVSLSWIRFEFKKLYSRQIQIENVYRVCQLSLSFQTLVHPAYQMKFRI